MASAFTHAVVAIAASKIFPPRAANWRLVLLLGICCSILPDIDAIGFHYGVPYGSFWGHRGFTHSILFALLLSGLLSLIVGRKSFLFLFTCTISHAVLDAMTNGGLGVAFFSPFNTDRYFFGVRPIQVSPIGVQGFFTRRGFEIILSEILWVWLPALVLCLVGTILRRNCHRSICHVGGSGNAGRDGR